MIGKLNLPQGGRLRAITLPVLAAAVLAGDVAAMGSHQPVTVLPRTARTLQIPEAMLVGALMDIRENRLSAALDRVNALLVMKPDFRLAQLIRGDLLMARARPLARMGAAEAPAERINDLREEARARAPQPEEVAQDRRRASDTAGSDALPCDSSRLVAV